MGTSRPGKLEEGLHACTFAGTISKHRIFRWDHAPYHCACRVFSAGIPIGEPIHVDQWGRVITNDQLEEQLDYWSGSVRNHGSIFQRHLTPWAEGRDSPVHDCRDTKGIRHICWNEDWANRPENERPNLPPEENCASYGAQLGQSMAFATIQLGEILTVLSFRRDSFCLKEAFSDMR